jgi:hypothetical protein
MLDHEFPEDDFDYGRDSHHYRPIEEEPWYPEYKKHYEDTYSFDSLSRILETGESKTIINKEKNRSKK